MRKLRTDTDRGVSIAVTHVLTIGITTILIAMLLVSGSTLLESETDRSAEASLETIGERLAGEIANVDQIVEDGDTESVRITADHPRTVANSRYAIEPIAECEDAPLIDDDSPCLKLTAQNIDVTVYVPIAIETGIESESVSGGTIAIVYDGGSIELVSENR